MTFSGVHWSDMNMIMSDIKFARFSEIQKRSTIMELFGKDLAFEVPLYPYSTAKVGGPAEFFLKADNVERLEFIVTQLWAINMPFKIIGGGSNILVSDTGLRGVVILNQSIAGKGVKFVPDSQPPTVWADSGVNFSLLARITAQKGYSGLEWAAGIPGTVGGAVIGNAGAEGSAMSDSLVVAEILQRKQILQTGMMERATWSVEEMDYSYRCSKLKRLAGETVVVRANLRLEKSNSAAVQAKMREFKASRRLKQPPGASLGSMFKNPAGDYAGRLIEAAGLKGARMGDAEISKQHANFFINRGHAKAADIYSLICFAQNAVFEKFGVKLDLEIELLGNFGSSLAQPM